jgi:osmotically inducible protein OsmC
MPVRKSEATWEGTLKEGNGTVKLGAGAETPFSWASRFEDASGTNPEELIGAAIAGCYTMQIGAYLTNAGHPPTRLHTTAHVTLEKVDGVNTITKIALVTEGQVPGVDDATFQEKVREAKEKCIISRALAAVGEITATATLQQ